MTETLDDDDTVGGRLRAAMALIDQMDRAASPAPWSYNEDHGRDHCDEGWSEITAVDANGKPVVLTYGAGYEMDHAPEVNASLMIVLRSAAAPIVEMLRHAAEQYEQHGLRNALALALADAVLERTLVDHEEIHSVQRGLLRTVPTFGGIKTQADS